MTERSTRSPQSGSEARLAFKDPANRRDLTFAVLPIAKVEVISHQRKASDTHVKRLVDSVGRVGFLAPVVVVEQEGGDGYLVIDGQHRLLAARELGLRRVPAVIAPRSVARRMLTLNVEKEPNIRERSAVALSIYREMVATDPKMAEDDAEVIDAIQQAHYVTLGLAYAQSGRLAGSSFEPILRKCDSFMDERLAECLPTRGARCASGRGARSRAFRHGPVEGTGSLARVRRRPDHLVRQPAQAGPEAAFLRRHVQEDDREAQRARTRPEEGASQCGLKPNCGYPVTRTCLVESSRVEFGVCRVRSDEPTPPAADTLTSSASSA